MLTDAQIETIWRLSETHVACPRTNDVVHKDECLFSFDSPLSPGGLFVNLKTWKAVSSRFLSEDLKVHGGSAVYLHLQFREVPVDPSPDTASKLAIGVAGGFQTDKTVVEKEYTVVVVAPPVFDNSRFGLDDPDLPEPIKEAADAVIAHRGVVEQEAVQAWEAQDERPVSRFSEKLVQETPFTVSMDPSTWRCGITGATDNLWLNLSDGFIGGGRRNFDGTGGSNGAADHYHEMKKLGKEYPLAVKLGTITAAGADVYSYPEDCMVTDPELREHLLHWGVDIAALVKTEKSLAELELELNKDFAFDKIVEAGDHLEAVSGPGLTGLKNMGNTCYLNSVVQLVTSVPEIRDWFTTVDSTQGCAYLGAGERSDPQRTLFELGKLVSGLWHPTGDKAVTPHAFRRQITRGHPEFASHRQQDAVEFLLHFMKEVSRSEHASHQNNDKSAPLESLFQFELEDRLACDGQVKYAKRPELVLSVQVTKDDVHAPKEAKRARPDEQQIADFQTCLARTLGGTKLDGFRSPVTGEVSDNASKSAGLASMPPYLLISVNRYYFTETYEAAKLDCAVTMPTRLSMEAFRSAGIQPGETAMSESPMSDEKSDMVAQLVAMGFPEPVCVRACAATKDLESALQWVLSNPSSGGADPETVAMLTSMGFTERHVLAALEATGGNAERAADWLFSHPADDVVAQDGVGVAQASTAVLDGVGEYELVGLVSHLGKSTGVGHNLAHPRRGDGWVVFNDELVAKSQNPPLDYGYLYLYRRVATTNEQN